MQVERLLSRLLQHPRRAARASAGAERIRIVIYLRSRVQTVTRWALPLPVGAWPVSILRDQFINL